MAQNGHLIKNLHFEVTTSQEKIAHELNNNASQFIKQQLSATLENCLDGLENKTEAEIMRIDSLQISMDNIRGNSMEEISNSITAELNLFFDDFSKKINVEASNIQLKSKSEALEDAFFFFLKNGHFPWWYNEKFFPERELKKLKNRKQFCVNLKNAIADAEVKKRLILQFEDGLLLEFASGILQQKIDTIEIPSKIREYFWDAFFNQIQKKNEAKLAEDFEKMLPKKATKKQVEEHKRLFNFVKKMISVSVSEVKLSKTKNKKETELKTSESTSEKAEFEALETSAKDYFLQNAGLVLLHPFLKSFFEKLEFYNAKKLQEKKIPQAVHVLHYLACKREKPAEQELLFEKFLCKVPINTTIPKNLKLTQKQKQECETLLESVLSHWPALKTKNTMILRNEFLCREGKLSLQSDTQKLTLERKTQDILLQKLPWTTGVLKLPWHEKILFVEW